MVDERRLPETDGIEAAFFKRLVHIRRTKLRDLVAARVGTVASVGEEIRCLPRGANADDPCMYPTPTSFCL
jgi:hypothetical protein